MELVTPPKIEILDRRKHQSANGISRHTDRSERFTVGIVRSSRACRSARMRAQAVADGDHEPWLTVQLPGSSLLSLQLMLMQGHCKFFVLRSCALMRCQALFAEPSCAAPVFRAALHLCPGSSQREAHAAGICMGVPKQLHEIRVNAEMATAIRLCGMEAGTGSVHQDCV